MPKAFRLPTLAPAEKSALAILCALLASGAALRAWESSGVSLGPVNDFETLRALVTRARASDATPWPCAPEAFVEHSGGAKKAQGKRKDGGGKKAPAGIVDLNTASERQLNTLPGVGPSTAKAIVAYRAAQGGFASPDDLLKVKGIGPRKFESLRPFVKAALPADKAPARAPGAGDTRPGAPAETAGFPPPAEDNPRHDTISRGSNAPP